MSKIDSIDDLILNCIRKYGSPQLAQPGAWMHYQHEAAKKLFLTILLRKCEVITWLWARQSGKTEDLAVSVATATLWIFLFMKSKRPLVDGLPFEDEMAAAFPEGLRVAVFSPKEESGSRDYERIQAMVEKIARDLKWTIRISNTSLMRVFTKGPDGEPRQVFRMELHSAAPGANVESGTFDLLVCEEAQDIEGDMILHKIDPSRAATRGTRVMIGTVGDSICLFDREIDDNKAYYPERHVEIPWQIPVRCGFQNGNYKTYVESVIAEKGADSAFFKRKFALQRDYSTGMLITEAAYIKLARPHEQRWDQGQPGPLPPNLSLIAGLDLARTKDFTILKIGTADWSQVNPADSYRHPWPDKILRFSKTYEHADYDEQWRQIQADLNRFPDLKICGCIAVDATGDRGSMAERLVNAGFYVLPVIFKGGLKETEIDDRGNIVPGSKSHLCQQYEDAITTGHFGFAATEEFMGSADWQRAVNIPPFTGGQKGGLREPSPEYRSHKHELTHAFRIKRGNAIVFCADPKDEHAHDDHVDSDMLFVLAANFHFPVDLSAARLMGQPRIMAGQTESFRSTTESIRSQAARFRRSDLLSA